MGIGMQLNGGRIGGAGRRGVYAGALLRAWRWGKRNLATDAIGLHLAVGFAGRVATHVDLRNSVDHFARLPGKVAGGM
jgi:hypothetical protein